MVQDQKARGWRGGRAQMLELKGTSRLERAQNP